MIFITAPITDGFSWSITSKLGHILTVAESKFGERDKSWTILGVEINFSGIQPVVWYPGYDTKSIIIRLTTGAINNMNEAVFQTSHEAIHCLSPMGALPATKLEEGVACHFSIEYCKNNGHGDYVQTMGNYIEALEFYQELIAVDAHIIRKLRVIEPKISSITAAQIRQVNPAISQDLADRITQPF